MYYQKRGTNRKAETENLDQESYRSLEWMIEDTKDRAKRANNAIVMKGYFNKVCRVYEAMIRQLQNKE